MAELLNANFMKLFRLAPNYIVILSSVPVARHFSSGQTAKIYGYYYRDKTRVYLPNTKLTIPFGRLLNHYDSILMMKIADNIYRSNFLVFDTVQQTDKLKT